MEPVAECWYHVEEVWNKWGASEVILQYGGGLLSSPHRVYVFKVGAREFVCTWDGESAVLDKYPISYKPPLPPEEKST